MAKPYQNGNFYIGGTSMGKITAAIKLQQNSQYGKAPSKYKTKVRMKETKSTLEHPIEGWKMVTLSIVNERLVMRSPLKVEDIPMTSEGYTAKCSAEFAHRVPDENCSCGFWNLKEFVGDENRYWRAQTALAGKIIVGTEGWRSEWQRVLGLYPPLWGANCDHISNGISYNNEGSLSGWCSNCDSDEYGHNQVDISDIQAICPIPIEIPLSWKLRKQTQTLGKAIQQVVPTDGWIPLEFKQFIQPNTTQRTTMYVSDPRSVVDMQIETREYGIDVTFMVNGGMYIVRKSFHYTNKPIVPSL